MSLSPRIRDALPLGLRRTLRRGQRFAVDMAMGRRLSAPSPCDTANWALVSAVSQPLGTTPNAAAKRHNIVLAAAQLTSRPLAPGAMFSFWGWLGPPSRSRGYQEGRALRGGELVLETGGGLCQLAGALYFAGLLAGLRPVERHAHSIDLYTDETRYAPLGSDATVSFGFKDLRLRNPHDVALSFDVGVLGDMLRVHVLAQRPVQPVTAEFRRSPMGDAAVSVETWIGAQMIARSVYRKLSSAIATSPPSRDS